MNEGPPNRWNRVQIPSSTTWDEINKIEGKLLHIHMKWDYGQLTIIQQVSIRTQQ